MSQERTTITRLWHATVLIELPYLTILTDPVLFSRIGIKLRWLPTLGPKRFTPPAMTVEQLPPIDIILLSHAHMDHLDVQTLRAITHKQPYKITCITAMNTKKWVKNFQRKEIYELDWDQELELLGIRITAGETRHRWARYPRNADRSQEALNGAGHNSYMIEFQQNNTKKEIVFWWDTAYTHAFKKWSTEHVDVAIMPIGAYDPFRFQHCTPEEALKMAKDMNSKVFIPIHWNTFILSKEKRTAPLERLQAALEHDSTITLGLYQIGEQYTLS